MMSDDMWSRQRPQDRREPMSYGVDHGPDPRQAMERTREERTAKWTLKPGRVIARDGLPVAHLQREEFMDPETGRVSMLWPAEADDLVRRIVKLLNRDEERSHAEVG